jgi:hypothetical protein
MSNPMLALGNWHQGSELVLILALVIAAAFLGVLAVSKPRRWRSRTPYRPDLTDVGQQLHAVMAGSFEKRRVLSTSEYRIFAIVENEIAVQRLGYRVFAQTSLGEILRSSNQAAFQSINSKRVDILVVDRGGWPCLAIEYQGDGHFQGTAAARDAVKKEALRKAGVRYMEFNATDTDNQIRSRLREHLASKITSSTRI